MAIHSVFIASAAGDGTAVDRALRGRFAEVYRVGVEFWLVDSGLDAERVAAAVRSALPKGARTFVAALSRDFAEDLSDAARVWLTAPGRSWRERSNGLGRTAGTPPPIALAA